MAGAGSPLGLTFTDFLGKMKSPAAADLVRNIKSFIRQFEERPMGHDVDPEVDSAQVQAFLAQSEQQFRQHPVWRGCQAEVLDQAVEGLEKYVMSKVWRQTFGVWRDDQERDERYQRLMQALGFVDLPTLMGVQVEPDGNLLALAQSELLKMDRYKAPRDKLLCLVNVKTMVENIVQLAAHGGANIGGADAFFPVFLFVVIRSRLPHLAANVEYIKRFRSRSRLTGQFDYMLCNLESAAMYLDTVSYEHLSVSREAFLSHLAAAGIPEAHMELHSMRKQQQQQGEAQQQAGQQEEQQQQQEKAHEVSAAALAGLSAGPSDSVLFAEEEEQSAAEAGVAGLEHPACEVIMWDEEGATDASSVLARLHLTDLGTTNEPHLPPHANAPGAMHAVGSWGAAGLSAAPTSTHSAHLVSSGGSVAGRTTLALPATLPGQSQALATTGFGSGGDSGRHMEAQQPSLPPKDAAPSSTAPVAQHQGQAAAAPARVAASRAGGSAAGYGQQQDMAGTSDAAAREAEACYHCEASLIEEMVAEGIHHVLAAEASGQLQRRYPFMYAQAEDLSLVDVQAVVVAYKELLLRYEALSRTLQQQLGVPGVAGNAVTHRSKHEQQQHGFGSIVLSEPEAGAYQGSGSTYSDPMAVAAGSGGHGLGSGSEDVCLTATGRWSPGGILHRIASSKARLNPVELKDGRTAAAGTVTQQGQQHGESGRLSRSIARLSPTKQSGQQAFFSAIFGSSSSAASSARILPAGKQEQQQHWQQKQESLRAHEQEVQAAACQVALALPQQADAESVTLQLNSSSEAGETPFTHRPHEQYPAAWADASPGLRLMEEAPQLSLDADSAAAASHIDGITEQAEQATVLNQPELPPASAGVVPAASSAAGWEITSATAGQGDQAGPRAAAAPAHLHLTPLGEVSELQPAAHSAELVVPRQQQQEQQQEGPEVADAPADGTAVGLCAVGEEATASQPAAL